MDPTSRFFAKLRKIAVNLETRSAELQRAYDTRNDDDDDDEKKQRAMRACYELSSEVKEFKSQVEADLKQQRQRVTETQRFLDACLVMKRKVGEDMETIRKHCEKYGYHEAPQKTLRGTEQQQQQQQEDAGDEKAGRAAEDAEKVGDEEDSHPAAASVANLQRTPQFSDFGLSEANLRRRMVELEAVDASGEAEFSGAAVARGGAAATASSMYLRSPQFSDFGLSEVDLRKRLQGPDVTAPSPYFPPSLYASGVMPQTPKCTLRMDDDDEVHTPQAPYFGLSEHTMCLNNDFTMDLQRKDVELQAAGSSTVSALHPGTDGSALPVDGMFLSPNSSVSRIRTKGAYGRASSPPPPEESPFLKKQALCMPLKSPEVPQVYLNRVLGLGEKHTGVASVPVDGGKPDWDLPTPANRTKPGQRPWEYDVPEMSLDDRVRTPETPVLESDLWLQLSGSRGVASGQTEPMEPSVPILKLDDPMKSPVMPDLSSETLTNIHHMLERKMAVVLPNHRPPGKENRRALKVISEVTQAEFQRLPSYLRQMPLSSLNQAVQKLNQAAAESQHDENEDFNMLELKRMAGLDTAVSKAPVYFLCLTELNRLKQVRGVGMNSEYRLVAK